MPWQTQYPEASRIVEDAIAASGARGLEHRSDIGSDESLRALMNTVKAMRAGVRT